MSHAHRAPRYPDPIFRFAINVEKALEVTAIELRGQDRLADPRIQALGLLAWTAWTDVFGVTDQTVDEFIDTTIQRVDNPELDRQLLEVLAP